MYSNEKDLDLIIGKLFLLDYIFYNFNSFKNFYNDEEVYNLDTNENNYEVNYLSRCLPYLFNKENWIGYKVFPKKELLEERKKLIEEFDKLQGELK